MRVLVVRHHDVDDAGFIGAAFAARGAELTVHLVPDDGPLPPLDGVDHVVVLGAKWSVYDVATIGDWIGPELSWLREADQAGVPVLGICFGAQALAAALGGRVEHAGRDEIGWTAVDTLDPAVVPAGPWLEFHHDRFHPPRHARLLARNGLGAQAFSVGRHLAFQFHPEVDGAQFSRWLEAGARTEAEQAGQDPDRLLAQTRAAEPAARERAFGLVESAIHLAAQHEPETLSLS
jgi:GMP synthase-like glutamine amidotransferase